MISRRKLMASGGLYLACLTVPGLAGAARAIREIKMESDADGARVWFDPIGLYVAPGTTIRWTVHHNTHTVAAYHPDNDGHSLRIPKKAKPWNSDFLVEPGENFEVVLNEPGVYDYYCEPHEAAGMAGRIIVGEISGPGAMAYDYFKKHDPAPDWQDVPEAVQCTLPDPGDIVRARVIPFKLKEMARKCNL